MSLWTDLLGTTRSFFRIGFAGPRLKNNSGALQVRNPGDTADADVTAAILHASGDSIEINSDAAGTGTDYKLTLARNSAASADLTLVTPPAKGTDGYLLRQKAGTSSGVLELELVAPAGTGANTIVDTTNLAFGSTSPVAMLTYDGTAVIDKIKVIVDTPFTGGTPSLSIGISGTTSKYMASTDVDLTAAAATEFEVHPGLPAPGSAESLIATYAANGASAGAARIIVYYADAPV